MRKIFIFLVVLTLLVPTTKVVFADTKDGDGVFFNVRQRIQEEASKLRNELRVRTENATSIRLEERQRQLQGKIQEQREEFRVKLKERRAETQKLLEQKREELRTRLQQIKDEAKRKVVERINERISELSERLTRHFADVLDKLEKILANISSRADKVETVGLNVSAVRTAITDAVNAIAVARTAVTSQASRVYSFTITSEENLRADVGSARQTLHDDLVAVRNAVFAARDAVHEAAVTLGRISGVNEVEIQ